MKTKSFFLVGLLATLMLVGCGKDKKRHSTYDDDDPEEASMTSCKKCPDDNHPHMIDLGLPSGTLWACCNEGASNPEDFGGYYKFDEVSSAPSLKQIKELVDKCSYSWTTLNGVNGGKFTGPSGGTVFLPAAGGVFNGELGDVGGGSYYWSSKPCGESNAYSLCFDSHGANWRGDDGRYDEFSVRPVSK